MEVIKGFVVEPLPLISETEKGGTYRLPLSRNGEMMLGQRKAGSINGRHFHEGKSATKGPEIFVLLSGKMEITARNLHTLEQVTEQYDVPVYVEFHPYVWHEVIAITDITFIELNSLEEHIADTVYRETLEA